MTVGVVALVLAGLLTAGGVVAIRMRRPRALLGGVALFFAALWLALFGVLFLVVAPR